MMIEQWKQASADLTVAISRFFDLFILLEKQCTAENEDMNNLLSHIDSTLGIFQTTIDSKLTQARVSLAKTRNKLTSPHTILSLPQEILSEIFLNVAYARPRGTIDMEKHVRLIYSRLYSLLGVCATWRHVGLSCGALWSIVPVIDSSSGQPRPRPLSTELSLHRAGDVKGSSLAIYLVRGMSYGRLHSIKSRLSHFNAINIQEHDSRLQLEIVLSILLKDGVPPSLSKLSLAYSRNNQDRIGQPTGSLSYHFNKVEPRVNQLVKSLSALRLYHVALFWQDVVFSSRLVTLQIGGISLGFQHETNTFMSALATATELRDLRLVRVVATPSQFGVIPTGRLILPKLESLQLEGLAYNVLSLFIGAIYPKTHRLTLNLYSNVANAHVLLEDFNIQPQIADNNKIYARLKDTEINKLVLNRGKGSAWDSPDSLQKLLASVPSVKTLVLNHIDLSQDTLKALNGSLVSPLLGTQDRAFPKFETIEIHRYSSKCLFSELKTGFEDLLATHPIKCLVLGRDVKYHRMNKVDEGILEWLKAAVPSFRWLPREGVPLGLNPTWELWDI